MGKSFTKEYMTKCFIYLCVWLWHKVHVTPVKKYRGTEMLV